jgi:hypothetical protein
MWVRSVVALAGGMAVGVLAFAAPSAADPGQPGCAPFSPVCNLLPTLPELDHDIDLTTGQPPALDRESLPPADPCAAGCI